MATTSHAHIQARQNTDLSVQSRGLPVEQPRPSLLSIVCAMVLVALTVYLAFGGVLDGTFLNIDDNEYVTSNPVVRSGVNRASLIWAFTHAHSGHWHPLTWVSHMIDCEVFGLNAPAHHGVNLALHMGSMALLLSALTLLTQSLGRSLIVTLLTAVSPLRLESVAWVSERKDVLSMLFAMLALNGYALYVRRPSVVRYALGVAIPFTLGLLAKPMIVSLPIILLAIDFWPLGRIQTTSYRRLIGEKVPLFVLAGGVSIAAIIAQRAGGGLRGFDEVTLSTRAMLVGVGYLAYIGKFFWPFGLSIFYPVVQMPSGVTAGAFAALCMASTCVWRARKRAPYLLAGWIWFVAALAPVIGIVSVGGQFVADRWTYLPHVGFALGFVWFIADAVRGVPWLRAVAHVATIVGTALLIGETVRAVPTWRSSTTIFSAALVQNPDNFFAHTNLGTALEEEGRETEAVAHYDEAIRLHPRYAVALNNRGAVYARQGDFKRATELFDAAIRASPHFAPALYHMGLVNEMSGRSLLAMALWIQVLKRDPFFERARESLSLVNGRLRSISCGEIRQGNSEGAGLFVTEFSTWDPGLIELQLLKQQMQSVIECVQGG